MLLVGALALLCVVQCTDGTNAGLEGKITQKGLNYGLQVGMEVLKTQLKQISIPDQSGTYSIPVIGDVDYSVSGMHIQHFELPQSSVGLTPGMGIKLSIGGATIRITGNWHVKVMFISDGGSFDLSVNDLSISAVLGVTRDGSGHPAVWNAGCISNIGGLHITFHGGASWLYNLFTGALEGPLRDQLNGQLCSQVGNAIGDLERTLKTMQVSCKIDPFAEIDYSLIDAPRITERFMDLGFKGEFYNVGHHSEPPIPPAPFSIPDQDNQMLYIGVSEFFANSAGYVYFTSEILRINLTDDMIPKESPIRLNTDSFGPIIPELPKLYPNMSVILQVAAKKQPTLTCLPGSLDLAVSGSIMASAILPNSTLAPLFLLQLDSIVKGKVFISGEKMCGSLELHNFSLSLDHTYVGVFQVDKLQTMLSLALRFVVVPKVNAKLSEGFPMPSIDKLKLVNPSVTVNQGYMLIGTDVQYSVDQSTAGSNAQK